MPDAFFHFLLPDLCQIVARLLLDWGDPRARLIFCARFLDFQKKLAFPFGEAKLIAPLIAIPNVDKANRRQEKGKKLN